ncbi:MAG: helix-turn-helix domain-containing protein [Nitrospirota bacterium]
MEKKLIGVKEASTLIGIRPNTLYLWSAQKKDGLPSHKVGRCRRFDPEELMEWAKRISK